MAALLPAKSLTTSRPREEKKMSKRTELERWLEDEHERETWEFPGASTYTVIKPLNEPTEADLPKKAAKNSWRKVLSTAASLLF